MKLSRKAFAAFALVFALSAAAWACPNEPTGFNGIAWGSRWEDGGSGFWEDCFSLLWNGLHSLCANREICGEPKKIS